MCLGIPGEVVELLDSNRHLAKVDVAGVRRNINIDLLEDETWRRATGCSSMSASPWPRSTRRRRNERSRACRTDGSGLHRRGSGGHRVADRVGGDGPVVPGRAIVPAARLGAVGAEGGTSCDSSMSTGTRRRRAPWWPASPSWRMMATTSSWRSAVATRTRSTAMGSSTFSRPRSSWCTAPVAPCASSRWAASTTPSPWPRRPGSSSPRSAT